MNTLNIATPVAYVVTLKLRIGDYEKTSTDLIINPSKEEAEIQALLEQCHCELGDGAEWLGDDFQQIEDFYGEMIYTVKGIKSVTGEELEILKKFL